VCLPHAGAGAGAYRGWPARVGPEVAVLPVQLPGREERLDESPRTSAAEIATELTGPALDLLRWPYVLFGHSMGALLAFELAHALSARGRGPARLVVSGFAAPQASRRSRRGTPLHLLPDEALAARLRKLSPRGAAALDEPELREPLLRAYRADATVCDTYEPPPRPLLLAPITVLNGDADPAVPPGSVEPWRELTTAPTDFHRFPGGHFYLDDHLDRLLEMITAGLPRRGPARGIAG
jgi:surfactin synthase thioesterase subunit